MVLIDYEMKRTILLSMILCAAAMLAGCEETEVPEAKVPKGEVTIMYGGTEISESQVFSVYRGESEAFSFSYEGVSRIVPETPEGWDCTVNMTGSEGTITVTAPDYSDQSSATNAVIKLLVYDGTGGEPGVHTINVSALSREMEFEIILPEDLSDVQFSLGSQCTFTFVKSISVKDLLFKLPKGWTAETKDDGTFVITAPDLTEVDGESEGTIVVIPVGWDGTEGTSIVKYISVRESFDATFEFVDKELSFNPGETKEVAIICKGIRSYDAPVLAAGWSGDFSKVKSDGIITLTAPADDANTLGAGTMVLSAIDASGQPLSTSAFDYRLYGINNAEEFLAFRDIYGATSDAPVTSGLDKYLVDGEIYLTRDITLTDDMMASVKAYFIKRLVMPLNGGGHCLYVDFSSTFGVCAIVQYVMGVKVHDIKLKGKLTNNTAGSTRCAGFCSIAQNGASFENIESELEINFNPTAADAYNSWVGGIVAQCQNEISFNNCKVGGTINLTGPVHFFGGLAAQTPGDKPGSPITFTDCELSGTVIYSQTETNNQPTRWGGMAGDFARNGTLVRCTFSGKMIFNLGGNAFITKNSMGVGGILGRITAPANGYNMKADLSDCKATGSIIVNDASPAEGKDFYGLIIGCIPPNADSILTERGSVCTGSLTFN